MQKIDCTFKITQTAFENCFLSEDWKLLLCDANDTSAFTTLEITESLNTLQEVYRKGGWVFKSWIRFSANILLFLFLLFLNTWNNFLWRLLKSCTWEIQNLYQPICMCNFSKKISIWIKVFSGSWLPELYKNHQISDNVANHSS